MKSRIVCLLPARNAAADLPGFFDSASLFADAIVALDDGSTDTTGAILRTEPLVASLLINPQREGYSGWNDAANRNALLTAAAELRPEWIISIDADERIPAGDARALREFLDQDALPGIGYGFRCFSMAGDLNHALDNPIWVYRLFAFQEGQAFPNQPLHFAPIPSNIPRRAFLRTTFRIQHLGGISAERRVARYEKYRQADPECRYWPDYTSLLVEPGSDRLIRWTERSPAAPVLYSHEVEAGTWSQANVEFNSENPELTVIVIDDGHVAGVMRAVRSARSNLTSRNIDVCVVTSRTDAFADVAGIQLIYAPDTSSRVSRRNLALRETTSSHVLFLDSTLSLIDGAIDMILDAHQQGYAVVCGSIEHESADRWASIALNRRFGPQDEELGSGIVDDMPHWASFSRSLLIECGGFDESTRDPDHMLARKLEPDGYLAYSVGARVARFRPGREPSPLSVFGDAFNRGVAESRFNLAQYRDTGRLLENPAIRTRLLRPFAQTRIRTDSKSTESFTDWLRSDPTGRVTELAEYLGESLELFRPGRNKTLALVGRPAGVALVVLHGVNPGPVIALVRFDLNRKVLRIIMLPDGLKVPDAMGQPISLHGAIGLLNPSAISRFAVNDLIGRPFQLEIDEIIAVSKSELSEEVMETVNRLSRGFTASNLLRELGFRSGLAILQGVMRREGIFTDLSTRSLALALVRLSRFLTSDIHLMRLPVDGFDLDSDAVEMTRSFLEVEMLERPATQRNRLRMVEWA